MRYLFVTMNGSREYERISDIPHKVRGLSRDWSQERSEGLCVPREELDNQPLFEGFLSPMWDGGALRYETQEVYDILSR